MMDEMVSMDGLVDSVSEIRASTDSLKSIRFFTVGNMRTPESHCFKSH